MKYVFLQQILVHILQLGHILASSGVSVSFCASCASCWFHLQLHLHLYHLHRLLSQLHLHLYRFHRLRSQLHLYFQNQQIK